MNSLEIFKAFKDENFVRLEQKLGQYNKNILETSPKYFKDNMEYFTALNSGGKMLRAILVNMGYYICGGKDVEYSDELALSIEIFQSSILVHDDLLDHAETRRGKDTVHVRLLEDFKIENEEILKHNPDVVKDLTNGVSVALGYVGLYMAYERLLEAYGDNPNLIKILREYNDMVIKTVEGGIMDVVVPFQERYKKELPFEESDTVDAFELIEQLALLKTAYYTTMGPIALGMMLRGADAKDVLDVEEIMKDAGLAFQIQDDLLGVYADEKVLGKDVGSDVSEFKQTFLYTYIKVNKPEVLPELNKYYGKDKVSLEDLEKVRAIFKETGAYDFTVQKMNFHYNRAKENVEKLSFADQEAKDLIMGFILYLESRKK